MYSKKDLYIAFLQASSIRYSCNALSDVTPVEASHDVFSKWLKNKTLKPSEVWHEAKNNINNRMRSPYRNRRLCHPELLRGISVAED